jgi:lysophospholipase L1-like esterase
VLLEASSGDVAKSNYVYVLVDNKEPYKEKISSGVKSFQVKGLSNSDHFVRIVKLTESFVGKLAFRGVKTSSALSAPPVEQKRLLEFIGNSITCGYGNEGTEATCPFTPETENNYLAYCGVASRALNADYHAIAYSGKGMYRNYDGTTKESMSLVYDRVFPDEAGEKWDFNNAKQPDVVVISLGTNDCAKGVPDSVIFVNTYVNFLKRIRAYYPQAYIICMEGPMTSNDYPKDANALRFITGYITASANVFIKRGDKKMCTYFPAVQKPEELGCDYHPNVKKHASMGLELANLIKNKMGW